MKTAKNKNVFLNVCCLLILCICYPTFIAAADVTEDTVNTVKTENKCAIGISDFPWNVNGGTELTFKWWNDKENGKLLVLGDGGYWSQNDKTEYSDGSYNNNNETKGWELTGFRYYSLRREKVGKLDDFYGIWGSGVGFYYNDQKNSVDSNDAFSNDADNINNRNYGISLRFPVGLEHFFLKSCPNLSYSILIDIYASWNHTDSESSSKSTASTYMETRNSHSDNYRFGASPMFSINYYFK